MLCFVFAALVVILDQLIKQWVVRTVPLYANQALIPGVLGLTHVENKGAAFSMLSDQRWLLAGISFVAVIILITILLRYNEGFWGTLGLAAVLGGAFGNLLDRVFNGYVVDMFKPLFVEFAIFNIADIFITLGGITFCVFFTIKSFRPSGAASGHAGHAHPDDDSGSTLYDAYEDDLDEDPRSMSDTKVIPSKRRPSEYVKRSAVPITEPEPVDYFGIDDEPAPEPPAEYFNNDDDYPDVTPDNVIELGAGSGEPEPERVVYVRQPPPGYVAVEPEYVTPEDIGYSGDYDLSEADSEPMNMYEVEREPVVYSKPGNRADDIMPPVRHTVNVAPASSGTKPASVIYETDASSATIQSTIQSTIPTPTQSSASAPTQAQASVQASPPTPSDYNASSLSALESLESLESELLDSELPVDYDVDALLREYGFED